MDQEIQDVYDDPMFCHKTTSPTLKEFDFWSYIMY